MGGTEKGGILYAVLDGTGKLAFIINYRIMQTYRTYKLLKNMKEIKRNMK